MAANSSIDSSGNIQADLGIAACVVIVHLSSISAHYAGNRRCRQPAVGAFSKGTSRSELH
jgi:hypothetical protein